MGTGKFFCGFFAHCWTIFEIEDAEDMDELELEDFVLEIAEEVAREINADVIKPGLSERRDDRAPRDYDGLVVAIVRLYITSASLWVEARLILRNGHYRGANVDYDIFVGCPTWTLPWDEWSGENADFLLRDHLGIEDSDKRQQLVDLIDDAEFHMASILNDILWLRTKVLALGGG
jgi:hypothetical protein